MVICLSPGGQTTTITDSPTETLFVGTVDGIFTFTRADGSWKSQSRFLSGEHISALLFEPASGTLFAGTYQGALHASTDLGKSWEKRDGGIDKAKVFTLALQKRGERARLYVGTEPAHLFFSDDLGRRWTELPSLRSVPGVDKWTFPAPPHVGHVKNLAFDAKNPNVLYAAIEVGGLLKSTDGGATWSELQGLYEDVHRAWVTPSNPRTVYVVTPANLNSGPSGLGGICLSQDGGSTWQRLTDRDFRIGYPDALLMHPKNESLMFTAGGKTNPGSWRQTHTADPRIARSRDGGRNWEILNSGLPDHIRGNIEAMALDVWKSGFALFAATTDGDLFYSEDEGDNWKKIAQGIAPISKVGHYRNLQAA